MSSIGIDQQRVRVYMYQLAQSLIVHDDFTILPYDPQDGQLYSGELLPVILYRRKWNTLQLVRIQPADGYDLSRIEAIMQAEIPRLQQAKLDNGVSNAYSLTLFIFSQWRSPENMKAIGETAHYEGMRKSLGAAAAGIDLAHGELGPTPQGGAANDITWERVQELTRAFPDSEFPEHLTERSTVQWQNYLVELSERRLERIQQTVAPNPEEKPYAMYVILALTILIYLFGQWSDEIVIWGLMIPEAIRAGEFWRLISPVFMHYELTHIAFNMLSLYAFGRIVERIYGTGRFLVIYLLSGLTGVLLSFLLGDNPSLGASGAIFGLFGALLAFGQIDRKTFSMTIGSSVYGLVAINLVMGFVMPRIDYWGHIGGLIGGYLVALAIGIPRYATRYKLLYAVAVAAFAVFAFWGGMTQLF